MRFLRPFSFILTTCLILFPSLTHLALGQSKPLNVLFIAVDDLRPELGCYGADYAETPSIDELARTSTLFVNHFVQVPTCGASRYALLTGRSPLNSGVTRSNGALYGGASAISKTKLAAAQTLPELFRRSGYQTTCIGKISHTADGRVYQYNGSGDGRPEVPHAWDDLPTPFGPWKRGWGIFFAYNNGKHREDGQGHKDVLQFSAVEDTDLPDGLLTETAIARLALYSKSSQPFFLGLGFFKPHLPFVATKGDWDAFADVKIPAPPYPEKPDSEHYHGSGEFFKYTFPFSKTRPLDDRKIHELRRAYLACVRYTDRQVGKVLLALKQYGLADNTIVVLWGDHGWNLGDSHMWAKHAPFERAVRSPLIIRVPGLTAGKKSTSLVETIDVYPTLLALAKPTFNQTQYPLDGKDMTPILKNPQATVREAALSFWGKAVSVRTDRYRLITSKVDGRYAEYELFDETTGFDPVRNLAGENMTVVQELLRHIPGK
jgi:arylsulfatase A-like enzyme